MNIHEGEGLLYPRSGVVLDCIDSLSLHPYLLLEDRSQPR